MTDLIGRHDRARLIGVIHLLPLPGSPRPSPGLDAIVTRARADAIALREGGADAAIVENYGDAPFSVTVAPPVVAAMTRVVLAVRDAAPDLAIGVNVLRNDGLAAVAVAAATGARFVRVNVFVGAAVTDQGVVEGRARELLLERARLGALVAVAADVHVKHARPLAPGPIEDEAADAVRRGGADAVIVTGPATGRSAALADVEAVRAVLPDAPVWVGSGVTPANAAALRSLVDAAIVGTGLHEEGDLDRPLDVRRVAAMRSVL